MHATSVEISALTHLARLDPSEKASYIVELKSIRAGVKRQIEIIELLDSSSDDEKAPSTAPKIKSLSKSRATPKSAKLVNKKSKPTVVNKKPKSVSEVLLASSSDDDSLATSVLLANIRKKPSLKDPPPPAAVSVAIGAVNPTAILNQDNEEDKSVNLLDPETQEDSLNLLEPETQAVNEQRAPLVASIASVPPVAYVNPFAPVDQGLSLPGNRPYVLNAYSQSSMSQLTQHSAFPNNQWNSSFDPLCRVLSDQEKMNMLMAAYNGNSQGYNYGLNPLPSFGNPNLQSNNNNNHNNNNNKDTNTNNSNNYTNNNDN
jgi:hypothetical protein